MPEAPEDLVWFEHLNYIILGASWQGAYFLYPKLIAVSQQERMI
nr:MAG TPA: hypothetical protein [Caudoviricetes sp.]